MHRLSELSSNSSMIYKTTVVLSIMLKHKGE